MRGRQSSTRTKLLTSVNCDNADVNEAISNRKVRRERRRSSLPAVCAYCMISG